MSPITEQQSTSVRGRSLGLCLTVSLGILSGCGLFDPIPNGKEAKGSISGVVSPLNIAGQALDPEQTPAPAEAVPGEYIIKFKEDAEPTGFETLSAADDLSELGSGFYLYKSSPTAAGLSSASVLSSLSARQGVEYVVPNRIFHPLSSSDDPLLPQQWALSQIKVPEAWDLSKGDGVVVGVVDSGIVQHPDLVDKLLPGADLIADAKRAGDGDGVDTDPTDTGKLFHGSHVAGIVAASTNNGLGMAGVSWGAKILPVRVMDQQGHGRLDEIMQGLLWAAGKKVAGLPLNPKANWPKVINLSVGTAGACDQAFKAVISTLNAAGITVVTAAGNDGNSGDYTPASCPGVINVGSVGPDGRRAPYSNYGKRIDLMAPGGNHELLVPVDGQTSVPGGIISTLYNRSQQQYTYGQQEGTSMAAPHVAGAAALLLSREPGLSPLEVKARLKNAAHPLSQAQCGQVGACGKGLLDVVGALKGQINGQTKAPLLVAALYHRGSVFDPGPSRKLLLDGPEEATPYTISQVQAGRYTVLAWQDLNRNGKVDAGEPLARSKQDVQVATDQALEQVNLALQPYAAGDLSSAAVQALEQVAQSTP